MPSLIWELTEKNLKANQMLQMYLGDEHINGMKDNRISNILKIAGLESCAVDAHSNIESFVYQKQNEQEVSSFFEIERNRSSEYLRTSLRI